MAKGYRGIIVAFISTVVLLGGGILIYKNFFSKEAIKGRLLKKEAKGEATAKEKTELEELQVEAIKKQAVVPKSKWKSVSFPMKKMMKGKKVAIVQKYLNRSPVCKRKLENKEYAGKPLYPLTVDEKFGGGTETALFYCYGDKKLAKDTYDAMRLVV